MKAFIFAAGLGTRLRPITNTLPKALVSVGGTPMLGRVIGRLRASGFTQIVINIHHFPEQIIAYIRENDSFGIKIYFSDERHQLLDTGGGLKFAGNFLEGNEPFLAHNVDILSHIDLSALYQSHLASPERLATLAVSQRKSSRYLLFDQENKMAGWWHKKEGTTLPYPQMRINDFRPYAFSGIQVISPTIFDKMRGRKAKFSIIDFYLEQCETEIIKAYPTPQNSMIDIGKTNILMNKERLKEFIKTDEGY